MTYSILSKHRSKLMGIALIFVLLFHCHQYGMAMNTRFLNDIFEIGFGGVDLFILLSSMGLTMSLIRKPVPLEVFMKKRCERILPAYYTVMIPYTLFLIISKKAKFSWLFFNAGLVYYWIPDSVGRFNWYISALFFFYVMTPFFVKKIASAKHKVLFTVITVAVSFILIELILVEGFWAYCDFFYRLPAFFMGILMGFFVSEDRKIGAVDIIVLLLMAACGITFYHMSVQGIFAEILPQWLFVQTAQMFIFTSVPVCILLCVFFEFITIKPFAWLIEELGKCSLEIYLLNASFFTELEIIKPLLPQSDTMRLGFLVYMIANVVLGIGLHYLIEGIRKSIQNKH